MDEPTLARRPSLRALHVMLVLACVLPAALAVGIAIAYSYRVERAALIERTVATARALSRRVDRELSSATAGLQALATSPALQAGDLASFEAQARQALQYQAGDTLVLSSAAGAHLLHTVAGIAHVEPTTHQTVAAAPAEPRPVVSDLVFCEVAKRPLVNVDVPVTVGRTIAYRLAMGFFPERLLEILATRPIPPEWVVSIFDSKGTIIARTHGAERLIGQPAVAQLAHALSAQREGTAEATLQDGRKVLAVFSHATMADWPVMIGIPQQELTGQLWRPLAMLVVSTVLLLAVGLLLARKLAGRIERSIGALVAPAAALGRGEKVDIAPLPLREAEEVAQALHRTARLLASRTAERDTVAGEKALLEAHARQLTHAADHDPLTGLVNRTRFHAALQRHVHACHCGDDSVVVLFIDVDDFKAVNDTHGHGVGDEVLLGFARRLLASVRDTDLVARLGGDEFAVMLVHAHAGHEQALARELTERLSRPYEIRSLHVQVSASIGIARCPGPGATARGLLDAADAAMYEAKISGKRRFAVSGWMPDASPD